MSKIRYPNDHHKTYTCDGPICKPSLMPSVVEYITSKSYAMKMITIPSNSDLTDPQWGWRRMVVNNKFSHVCPSCQEVMASYAVKEIDLLLTNALGKTIASTEIFKTISIILKKFIETYTMDGFWENGIVIDNEEDPSPEENENLRNELTKEGLSEAARWLIGRWQSLQNKEI